MRDQLSSPKLIRIVLIGYGQGYLEIFGYGSNNFFLFSEIAACTPVNLPKFPNLVSDDLFFLW